MTFVWVHKAVNGSVCKLWHHCTQSVQSHKSWKVRGASVMSSSTRPARLKSNFEENFSWYSCNLDVPMWQRNSNATNKLWPFSGLFSALFGFYWNFHLATLTGTSGHSVTKCSVQRRTNINNLTASKRAAMYCWTFSIVQETGTHFFAIRPQRYECYIEPDDYQHSFTEGVGYRAPQPKL